MKKLTRIVLALAIITMVLSIGACNNPNAVDKTNSANGIQATGEADNAADPGNTAGETVYTIHSTSSMANLPSIETMYERSDLVVVATFKEDILTFADPYIGDPATVASFNVLEVVKGEIDLNTPIIILYGGGRVTLEEYRNVLAKSPGRLEKSGLDKYTEEEAKNLYVEYVDTDAPIHLENNGQEYMLFLVHIPSDLPIPLVEYYGDAVADVNYLLFSGGYSIAKVNDDGQVFSVLYDRWETQGFYSR